MSAPTDVPEERMVAKSGPGGCIVTNTTSALLAQGTVTGVLLAGLVWAGVGILGLVLLWLFLMILLGILCSFLNWVCTCPDIACDGCSGGCCEPCDPCDECCGGNSEDEGGGSGGGGVEEAGDCGCMVPAASVALLSRYAPRRDHLAHHPDRPEYREDVYRLGGLRLCIGCFTTYPVFALLVTVLFLTHPPVTWNIALGIGFGLAALQVVSSLGRARTRLQKGSVKAALGSGLALYTYGTLSSPFGFWGQYGLLCLAVVLAMVSTIPRTLRMRRARAASEGSCRCDVDPSGMSSPR